MDALKIPSIDIETDADLEPATFDEQVHVCTPEEWWEIIEGQTRQHFGMSADEWVRKFMAGEFGDIDDNREVVGIAMLLPFDW
jgi:hypothetical protein